MAPSLTINVVPCRSATFSGLSFLLYTMGMIIPSSQDCCGRSKRCMQVLGKVWMPYKLKVVVLHKLGYSPKSVIFAICGHWCL